MRPRVYYTPSRNRATRNYSRSDNYSPATVTSILPSKAGLPRITGLKAPNLNSKRVRIQCTPRFSVPIELYPYNVLHIMSNIERILVSSIYKNNTK